MKACVICDFKGGVQIHHIIKRKHFGSDTEDNLVELCPNHHWLADQGTEEEACIMKKKIFEVTGKKGMIDEELKEEIEKKIKVLMEKRIQGCTQDPHWRNDYTYHFYIQKFLKNPRFI